MYCCYNQLLAQIDDFGRGVSELEHVPYISAQSPTHGGKGAERNSQVPTKNQWMWIKPTSWKSLAISKPFEALINPDVAIVNHRFSHEQIHRSISFPKVFPRFSQGFQVFPRFSQGFPMVFPRFSQGFQVFPRFSQGFPMVFPRFSQGFQVFPRFSPGFPKVFPGFSQGFPKVFPWFSQGFPKVFRFSQGFPQVFPPGISTCSWSTAPAVACGISVLANPTAASQRRGRIFLDLYRSYAIIVIMDISLILYG